MPELVLPGVTGWVVNLDIKDHFKSILERIADASSWNDISVQKMDEIFERQRAGLLAERYLNIYNETIARGGVRARIAR
jgi:hypothetical protein